MSNDRFHIIVTPPRGASADLIKRIGMTVGVSPYDVRLRMNAALPRSLAVFETAEGAIEAGAALGDLGVPTAAFSESRLPPAPPFNVRRWQWVGDDLNVMDRRDRSLDVKHADLACVVFGFGVSRNMDSHLEADVTIGFRGTVDTTYTVVKQRQAGLPLFALLIPRDDAGAAVLFDAWSLDFRGLPGRREPSDNANMRRLHILMEQMWPDVPVDRTLLQHRIDPEHCLYFNKRTCDDAAVAVSYALWYLRRAAEEPGGFFNALIAG